LDTGVVEAESRRETKGWGPRRIGWWLLGTAAVSGLLGALAVVRTSPSAPEPLALTKRTLARLPHKVKVTRLVTSDDGSRQASVQILPEGGCHVVDNGIASKAYRECGQHVFFFSGGKGQLFYDVVDEANQSWLVVDGVPIAMAEPRGDGLAWSRNGGRRWAATGLAADRGGGDGADVVVATDGTVLGPWVDASRPTVRDDDGGVAVVVQHPDATLGLVVDGAERRRYPADATPCGLPPPPAAELPRHVQLRYLSDGRLVQVAPAPDGWAVYRDDEVLAAYPVHVPVAVSGRGSQEPPPECEQPPAVQVGSISVAERAPVAAWWERVAGKTGGDDLRWRVSRDGESAGPVLCRWPAEDTIALTPDGRHVGFACAVGGAGPTAEVYAVLDGRRFGPYRQVWGVGISPDGSQLTYAAAAGGGATPWRVYRDGVPLSRSYWSIWPPRFSPDGRHVAWEALIDSGGRGVAGVDGDAVALFDGILSGPLFPAPNQVAWVALRGRRVVRLDLALRD
jgi:hypothetical protein